MCVLGYHKGYFVAKKITLNVGIKAFWYANQFNYQASKDTRAPTEASNITAIKKEVDSISEERTSSVEPR